MKTPEELKKAVLAMLPTAEQIKERAKKQTSFPVMCYPNSMLEIQCFHKYEEGAQWATKIIKATIEATAAELSQSHDEEMEAFFNWATKKGTWYGVGMGKYYNYFTKQELTFPELLAEFRKQDIKS